MSNREPAQGVACKNCPLRENPNFRKFESDELEFVQSFKTGELVIEAGETVLSDGHDAAHLYTVLEGWAVRLKYLPDGERQVLNFALPGDFLGLQATIFGAMQHTVEALTRVRLCVFSRSRLWDLYSSYPALGFDITWLAAREEAMLADHLVNVGQRSAFIRMAYLFAHIYDRARRAKIAKGMRISLPLTQEHVADALGLSSVHTNKTLRKLRATRCIEWSRGELVIKDLKMLHELGDFDPSEKGPRPFV